MKLEKYVFSVHYRCVNGSLKMTFKTLNAFKLQCLQQVGLGHHNQSASSHVWQHKSANNMSSSTHRTIKTPQKKGKLQQAERGWGACVCVKQSERWLFLKYLIILFVFLTPKELLCIQLNKPQHAGTPAEGEIYNKWTV